MQVGQAQAMERCAHTARHAGIEDQLCGQLAQSGHRRTINQALA